MFNFILLIISLFLIVIVANLFCNALEHLGEKLQLSESLTGSVFAAVGTALPETIIPIIALVSASDNVEVEEIGIGAILGAPLMLATLSLFVMAIAISFKRGLNGDIRPDYSVIKRDLTFFASGYLIVLLSIFANYLFSSYLIRVFAVILLVMNYFIYLALTIKSSKTSKTKVIAVDPLFLQKFGLKNNLFTVLLQILIALSLLIYFANIFVASITNVATLYKISPFLLSLIITPIATELPEKINSIMWLIKEKDTLAIGNITGAMVFQASFVPIVGILYTKWDLTNFLPIISIIITFIASIWFYFNVQRKVIKVWHFIFNGLLYLVNILLCYYFLLR